MFSGFCLSEIIVRPFISLMAKFEVYNVFGFLIRTFSASKHTFPPRHLVHRYLNFNLIFVVKDDFYLLQWRGGYIRKVQVPLFTIEFVNIGSVYF